MSDSTELYNLMVSLVRYYIFDIELDASTKKMLYQEVILQQLLLISKKHDLTHIVGAALEKANVLPKGTQTKDAFVNAQVMSIYRSHRLIYELNAICSVFEENRIDFIPLKGSVLRDYYKEPWMRTSCDIDILIHECDLDKSISVLKKKLQYYGDGRKGSHDVALFSKSNVCIELHYKFHEDCIKLDDVWNNSILADNTNYKHIMNNEMFYCYHIAHMAKHFGYGGCGIRWFLDIKILRDRFSYNVQEINKTLGAGNLCTFAQVAEELSDIWFAGNSAKSDLAIKMQDYVFQSGEYGNLENMVVIHQQKQGGKIKYAISRIFLPYNIMIFHYPSIEGKKILLPIYNIRRWFKLLFKGGVKRSLRELVVNYNISKDKFDEVNNLIRELDL